MATKEKPKTAASPILLNFQSVQQVVVTGPEGDRFVVTSREAALACRSNLDEKAWRREFDGFLSLIHEWSKAHANDVQSAYVGISSEGLTVVIVTKGKEYRIDLDDSVTRLDIELSKTHPIVRADVLQSPDTEPDSRVPYINIEKALQVYGNQE